ncbi:uncharacterized protein LOC131595461 [Vicia villosa]|uniref:uncharacterized protein LOC131595461 n=1 Tax=Vicia villosa TaxID=3911 RepID=UPI00273B414B|nr:uncharacterized protein LOC131595461 [Vicia villosa]
MIKRILKVREQVQHTQYWQTATSQRDMFSTSKLYQEIRGGLDQMSWRKIFFTNYARPRAVFILWLTFRGRIKTKDRLIRYGINVDPRCVFCSEEETVDHLMFQCRITNGIWKNILGWIGYHRSPDHWMLEQIWLTAEANKKGWRRVLLKAVVAETVYAIWRMHNDVIFKQHTLDDTITRKIKEVIALRCIGYRSLAKHINIESLGII